MYNRLDSGPACMSLGGLWREAALVEPTIPKRAQFMKKSEPRGMDFLTRHALEDISTNVRSVGE